MRTEDINKLKQQTQNEQLRSLEIKFWCLITDLCRLTPVPTDQNIYDFFRFLKKIDLTKAIDFDTIETLAETVLYEKSALKPTEAEWYNFILTNNITAKKAKKYFPYYAAKMRRFQRMKLDGLTYQPIHLRPPAYENLRYLFQVIEQIKNIGV